MRDLMGEVKVSSLFSPQARTASEDGSAIDTYGSAYGGPRELVCYMDVGVASGTGPTLNVKLQDSVDNSTFTDIAGAAFAQKTAPGTEELRVTGFRRYLKATATVGGTSPSFTFGVVAVAGKPRTYPV